ncbi:MAG TPA: hypothetical protein VF796_29825 [Humisphaera sp.]
MPRSPFAARAFARAFLLPAVLLNAVLLPLSLAASAAEAPSKLAMPQVLTPTAKQHERAEVALDFEPGTLNPFDPASVALDGVVTTPSGKTLRVPGFWYQAYTRSLKEEKAKDAADPAARVEVTTPVGKPQWRVRFSSGEVGVHRVVLELKDASGVRKAEPAEVKVEAGDRRGPIRVSPRNKTYLEDSAGRGFFPLGQNLCMAPEREGTYYYERILPKLAAAGANYVRLWQEYYPPGDPKRPAPVGSGSNAGFPLETPVTGLGKYDLESAWKLDVVSDLCDRHGVRWQICFENVVWWNRKMPWRWGRNPYNAANGGPCKEPADYLTSPRARDLAAARHRYSVARWGWSPNLLAWEMWNEVDNLDGFTSEANEAWHKDLAGRLKALDPFGHLVATSWRDPKMFALPQIDVPQAHSYWQLGFDAAEYTLQDSDHLMRPYGKPFFFGEQGMDGKGQQLDTEGRAFHDCLWASSLSGAAGAGMWWHWQSVDRFDQYHHYNPVAKFLDGVDFPAHPWKRMRPTRPSQPVTLVAYGLAAPDRALVWIHDTLGYQLAADKLEPGPKRKDASLNLEGLAEGNYKIEWWDTKTGEVIGTDNQPVKPLRHFGYGLELRPPEFQGDVAARVIRQGTTWNGK